MSNNQNDDETIERLQSMVPSQDEVVEGEEYLLPTTLVREARGGGERYEAIRIEVKEKHVEVDESPHKYSEGY